MRLFVDSPVFLAALGRPSPPREACMALLRRAAQGSVDLHTGAECIQEIVFHRRRIHDGALAASQTSAVRELCTVHAMDDRVLDTGLNLVRNFGARGRGFDSIVTTDTRFVEVPGLRRIDPRDLAA
jgi:predicted nucleic acid-binding protein